MLMGKPSLAPLLAESQQFSGTRFRNLGSDLDPHVAFELCPVAPEGRVPEASSPASFRGRRSQQSEVSGSTTGPRDKEPP